MKAKEFWKQVLVNTFAGILVLVLPSIFNTVFTNPTYVIISLQAASIVIIIATNIFLYRYRCKQCEDKKNRLKVQQQTTMLDQIGIVKIVPSTVTGEGSTEHILSECDDHFFFMGIAATKWIRGAQNFDKTMKKILARNGTVRIIMLNPMSTSARNMSIASEKAANYLKESILKNMKELKEYKDLGLDIAIKVYSHIPIFRIAIVDNEKIYVGHYQVNDDGEDLSQMVLNGKDKILFRQFFDYYSVTWDSDELKPIDLDSLDDYNYLATLEC